MAVLANKYRPKSLNKVIGQDIALSMIKNSIKMDIIRPCVILTGIRGVGKTTLARLIVKAINCENFEDDICNKCKNCIQENNPDSNEIDAASNTGVDDIRLILESSQYLPITSKYRSFIIDEVHMLSKSAFNAMLKTLEEAPDHAIFILATTEIDKVPDTILSRAIHISLHNVKENDIVSQLDMISNNECILTDNKALNLIAQFSGGSLRDAITIFDQTRLIGNVTYDNVKLIIGEPYDDIVIKILHMCLNGNADMAIEYFNNNNINSSIISILSKILKHIALYKHNRKENIDGIADLAEKLSTPAIIKIWQILLKTTQELEIFKQESIVLEMMIIKLCYASKIPDLIDFAGLKSFETNDYVDKNTTDCSKNNSNNKDDDELDFSAIVALFVAKKEPAISFWLKNSICPVICQDGEIGLIRKDEVPKEIVHKMSDLMKKWTGKDWNIYWCITTEEEAVEIFNAYEAKKTKKIKNDPIVKIIGKNFTYEII